MLNVVAVQDISCPIKMSLNIDGVTFDMLPFGEMSTRKVTAEEFAKDDELQWRCEGIHFKRKGWLNSEANVHFNEEEYNYICDCIDKAIIRTWCGACV